MWLSIGLTAYLLQNEPAASGNSQNDKALEHARKTFDLEPGHPLAKQRLRDIGEARIVLENAHGPADVSTQAAIPVAKKRQSRLAWIAGIALAFLAGGRSLVSTSRRR